jgi:hypothetical protein
MRFISYILITLVMLANGTVSWSQTQPKPVIPSGNQAIGFFGSYSNLLFNDTFIFDDIPNFYSYDEQNDSYEAIGGYNYRFGVVFQRYIGKKKIFSLNASAFYGTRNAELTANARFLVRDPVTKEVGQLVTVTKINTYFNSIYLQLGASAFVPLREDMRFYSTLSLVVGKADDNTSADFSAEIIGFIPPGEEEPVETNLTFSRSGTKKISFSVDDESGAVSDEEREVFQNAIMGSEFQLGFDIAFGFEWFFTDQFGTKLEGSGNSELLAYFQNQSSGILSSMNLNLSLLYAF